MYIKNLKPKKNGRFKQGYINPESCKKLYENLKNEPIIYRSSWERRFITWCESSPKVVAWGSECIHIPYYNPVDQKTHNYYPDFVVELVNGDKLVVEIKPENQTVRPTTESAVITDTSTVPTTAVRCLYSIEIKNEARQNTVTARQRKTYFLAPKSCVPKITVSGITPKIKI